MSGSDYTQTPILGLFKPAAGADVNAWGLHLNLNTDALDAAIGALQTAGPFLRLTGGTINGPVTLNGIFTVNETVSDPGAGFNESSRTLTTVTISATNAQAVWGHSSRMTLQTPGGGVSYTSTGTSAYFGQTMAVDTVAGGTIAWIGGVQGGVGNQGKGAVTNAADFLGRPAINSGGGSLLNHYTLYAGTPPTGRATNEYGFSVGSPSGIGTGTPAGWLEVRAPDNLATTRVLRFRNAAGSLLDIMGDGKMGFNAVPPVARPTVAGAWAGNAAGKAMAVAFAQLGLIIDSTTA